MSSGSENRLSLKRKKSLQPKLADAFKAEGGSHGVIKPGLPFSGLANLGNSCYANSILQALRFSPGFPSAIASLHSRVLSLDNQIASDHQTGLMAASEAEPLITHLHQLFQKMAEADASKEKVVIPAEFIATLKEENPVFTGYLQQDAHEMLRFLMIKLLESCSITPGRSGGLGKGESRLAVRKRKHPPAVTFTVCKVFKHLSGDKKPTHRKLTEYFCPNGIKCSVKPATVAMRQSSRTEIISNTFLGELVYQTHCFECDSYTRRKETFMDITVPVTSSGLPGFPPCPSSVRASASSSVGPYSLSWAIGQLASCEQLRGENKYFCDYCGRLVEAERSILFSRLPQVLTMHLNRFTTASSGTSSSVTVSKVSGNIAIPLTLSLNAWTSVDCPDRDRMYELFAAVFHSGTTCSSGHYTTYVRASECHNLLSEVKGQEKQQWILFNDDVVQNVSQRDLLSFLSPLANTSSTAYILFYRNP